MQNKEDFELCMLIFYVLVIFGVIFGILGFLTEIYMCCSLIISMFVIGSIIEYVENNEVSYGS